MNWTVETLDATVDEEVAALPADTRARLSRIAALIEASEPEWVREPYVKHLESPVWEMRMKGREGISRALYVTAGQRWVTPPDQPPK